MYKACPKGGTFEWQGTEVLKEYAGYMIEHVENELKKDDNNER
jgi:hypothetical protein